MGSPRRCVKRVSQNRLTTPSTVRKMPDMHKSNNPWVGRWLREVRVKAEIPVATVAAELKLHPTNILSRERGAASISADDLPAVLTAYGTTLAGYSAAARKAQAASR